MDKPREEFEADFENETGWSAGDYPGQEVVDLCWRLYQQSRASIVVDVPEACAFNLCDLVSRDDVINALRSIGLSIKGE